MKQVIRAVCVSGRSSRTSRDRGHKTPRLRRVLGVGAFLVALSTAHAADFSYIQITSAAPSESVKWYARHLDCEAVADRSEVARCDGVDLVFVFQPIRGSTQGTGINNIGFSYADLTAKMASLEAVGVRGSGVRLQRFDDGSTLRQIPGLYQHGFIFDPWGTRIELVEDPSNTGFHHLQLSASDPAETLKWYQDSLEGKPAKLLGKVDGLMFGDVWLLTVKHPEGTPATTQGRAVDHIAFSAKNLSKLAKAGVHFTQDPETPANARSSAKRGFVHAPDNVRVAVVEPDFAGVEVKMETQVSEAREPYDVPRAPWGEPDLQGVWTGNASHGIPLERPDSLANVDNLTAEQAAARRERGTLGSIWGYEREWRDTTLGYDKQTPSTQVAMIIDPPNGRLPAMTPEGKRRAAEVARRRADYSKIPPAGPEDLTPYVRCITKGAPGMMMPSIYNNGLQIVQGPGNVAIQKEMIHETRVIPTKSRERLSGKLPTYLGDPQGRWQGDTLVIETVGFNDKMSFRGSSKDMRLTERYTRLSETVLEYRFTVDDPATWTQPWTGRFTFNLDNEQYDLVEYACHEGNYGMFNILSGARAKDKAAAEAAK